jgi:hypothetical protein
MVAAGFEAQTGKPVATSFEAKLREIVNLGFEAKPTKHALLVSFYTVQTIQDHSTS